MSERNQSITRFSAFGGGKMVPFPPPKLQFKYRQYSIWFANKELFFLGGGGLLKHLHLCLLIKKKS